MTITVSNLSQTVISGLPTTDHLESMPHIYVNSGAGRRRDLYTRVFKTCKDVKLLDVTRTIDVPAQSTAEDAKAARELIQLARSLELGPADPIRILIDVSCLSRPVIAHIFGALAILCVRQPIALQLAYTLAAYAPPPVNWAKSIRTICPVHPSFSGWTAEGASAPLDVVVGLGYEKGKALGAVEYLEPRNRWIFVPNSPEKEYRKEVQNHNKDLLANNKNRTADYEVLSPVDTYFTLRSLVEGVSREARPVLLPFGPKLFFALNLLVAMTVDEASVWHVNGENDEYSARKPSTHGVLLSCTISHAGR